MDCPEIDDCLRDEKAMTSYRGMYGTMWLQAEIEVLTGAMKRYAGAGV